MGSWSDGAADLLQMQVHGFTVGVGHDQGNTGGPFGQDDRRCRPIRSGCRAGRGAASERAHSRVKGALLSDASLVLEPTRSACLMPRPAALPSPRWQSFFERLLRRRVGLRVARPYGQARELEPLEKPAHVIGDLDVEASPDLHLQVDAAPAHHPVHLDVRPGLTNCASSANCLSSSCDGRPGRGRSHKPATPSSLYRTDHRVSAFGRPHPGAPRCRRARGPFHHQRQRQKTPRLIAVLRPARLSAQRRRRMLRPRNRQRHDDLQRINRFRESHPLADVNHLSESPVRSVRITSCGRYGHSDRDGSTSA